MVKMIFSVPIVRLFTIITGARAIWADLIKGHKTVSQNALVEVTYSTVAKQITELSIKNFSMSLGSKTALKNIKIGGFVGAAGLFAALDVKYAYDEYKNTNYTMFGLYVTSATLGILSSYILTTAITGAMIGVGIVLVIVCIAIGLAINYFKNNEIQDWLRNGLWGKSTDQWRMDDEINRLKEILKPLNRQAQQEIAQA